MWTDENVLTSTFKFSLLPFHPKHFLPNGMALEVIDRTTGSHAFYYATEDGNLRKGISVENAESGELLPEFTTPRRHPATTMVNPLLLILAAHPKCARFLRHHRLPITTSDSDVIPHDIPMWMIQHAREVVVVAELLYSKVVPTPGSAGALRSDAPSASRRNARQTRSAHQAHAQQEDCDMDGGSGSGSGSGSESTVGPCENDDAISGWDVNSIQRRSMRMFHEAETNEERSAAGAALFSGGRLGLCQRHLFPTTGKTNTYFQSLPSF